MGDLKVFDVWHQESPPDGFLWRVRPWGRTINRPQGTIFLVSEKAIDTAPGMSRRGATDIGDRRRSCTVMLMPFSSASLMSCVVVRGSPRFPSILGLPTGRSKAGRATLLCLRVVGTLPGRPAGRYLSLNERVIYKAAIR